MLKILQLPKFAIHWCWVTKSRWSFWDLLQACDVIFSWQFFKQMHWSLMQPQQRSSLASAKGRVQHWEGIQIIAGRHDQPQNAHSRTNVRSTCKRRKFELGRKDRWAGRGSAGTLFNAVRESSSWLSSSSPTSTWASASHSEAYTAKHTRTKSVVARSPKLHGSSISCLSQHHEKAQNEGLPCSSSFNAFWLFFGTGGHKAQVRIFSLGFLSSCTRSSHRQTWESAGILSV